MAELWSVGRLWELAASRAFFTAYLDAAAGAAGVPTERAESERVVRFFMFEKALYEIAYELANRPDWVEIPLRGLLRLIEDNLSANGSVHQMPSGAHGRADGTVRFRLWAPTHRRYAHRNRRPPRTAADAILGRRVARGDHQSGWSRFAISLRTARRIARVGPCFPLPARGPSRAKRGGRPRRRCLDGSRMAEPSLGRGCPL
jgi:hypothetical protein